jgi:glucose/arabinose dehydrogenase
MMHHATATSTTAWIAAFISISIACATLGVEAQAQEQPYSPLLNVELIADGLVAPLDLTFAPNDDSGRRFIVDQNGLVFIMTLDNTILTDPFLNITDRVVLSSAFDERGLLGFAFHPNFLLENETSNNNKVYVLYSGERSTTGNICLDQNGTVPTSVDDGCPHQHTKRVSEFTLANTNSDDSDTSFMVNATSERVLFSMEWPGRKHNGGGLAFGPDGYLYFGLGDGGWVHGPTGADSALIGISPKLYFGDLIAQNLTEYFGKILRIDVDGGDDGGDLPYGIPTDNPFVDGDTGYPKEIFAWGFRNPYRISFDRNDYSADAGSTSNGYYSFFVSATAETFFEATYKVDGPGNYGWAIREGTQCIARGQPLVPPHTVSCNKDSDCPDEDSPQTITCGADGFCTCPDIDPILGELIHDPIIEYVNLAVHEHNESVALVEEGLLDAGLGRASVGGFVYRGSAIPWLYGKFVQGDFAIELLDGQIFVAEEGEAGELWNLKIAYVFNATDPIYSGFVKTIGQDADGELYAVTGAFAPTGLIGRVFKIVDASSAAPASTLAQPPTTVTPTTAPTTAPTSTSSAPATTSPTIHRIIISFGILAAACILG